MGILPNMAVISELQYQRIADALRMVEETFRATLAPEFTEEGRGIFLGLLNEDAFRKRQSAGNKSYVAKDGDALVGLLEVRGRSHVLLLFVRQGFQGQGIGRNLLEAYLVGEAWEPGDVVTVNAAPGSAEFYGALGFKAKDEWKVRAGIRYLAMERVF